MIRDQQNWQLPVQLKGVVTGTTATPFKTVCSESLCLLEPRLKLRHSAGNPNHQGTQSLSLFLKCSTFWSIFCQMQELPDEKLSPWSTLQLRLAHCPRDKAWPQTRQKKDQDTSIYARHYSLSCWIGHNYHVSRFCDSTDGKQKCSREPHDLFTLVLMASS